MAQQVTEVRQASVAEIYRDQLEALFVCLNDPFGRMSTSDVVRQLDEWLRQPDVRLIVDEVPGGADRVFMQVIGEYSRYMPSPASNASSPLSLVRILLLQQIDLAWWSGSPALLDTAAVAASDDLVDLRRLRAKGGLRFGFGIGSDRLVRRARDFTVQRVLPSREPRGPGLPFWRSRLEVVSVLNEIADRVALLAPPATPRIWVNSIVRSVEHQTRLRSLGFTALLPSAHCYGWAADIEMTWFDKFGAGGALREVILSYRATGSLNVIDEGRAWHVCLAPEAVSQYGAL